MGGAHRSESKDLLGYSNQVSTSGSTGRRGPSTPSGPPVAPNDRISHNVVAGGLIPPGDRVCAGINPAPTFGEWNPVIGELPPVPGVAALRMTFEGRSCPSPSPSPCPCSDQGTPPTVIMSTTTPLAQDLSRRSRRRSRKHEAGKAKPDDGGRAIRVISCVTAGDRPGSAQNEKGPPKGPRRVPWGTKLRVVVIGVAVGSGAVAFAVGTTLA